MITNKELDLLLEIRTLLNKYGEETFNDLIKSLKDESFVSGIEILEKSASNIKTPHRKAKAKTDYSKNIRAILSELEKNDFERFELLDEFSKKLDGKSYFGTLKKFSGYLNETGIYYKKVQTWAHGKFILISHFSKCNFSEVKDGINRINKLQHVEDRSLDAWSNIILDGSKKANK